MIQVLTKLRIFCMSEKLVDLLVQRYVIFVKHGLIRQRVYIRYIRFIYSKSYDKALRRKAP